MRALGEDLALPDDEVRPVPVGRVDDALAEQVLDAVEPGQLVDGTGVDQVDTEVLVVVEAAQLLTDADAAGLGLDEQRVHLELRAGLDDLAHEVGHLQPLLPRGHEHDAGHALGVVVEELADADALVEARRLVGDVLALAAGADEVVSPVVDVAAEDAPDREGAEVILGLRRVGRVERRDDIVNRRPALLDPRLPPVRLDDAAAPRGRLLLELPGGGVWAHDLLIALDDGGAEPLREEQLAVLGARVFEAEQRRGRARRIIFHRQHDVIVAELLVEDDAADVALVQALHDDDDGRAVGVVEARRDGLLEPLDRRVAHRVAVRAVHAVRVVDDDAVATSAGDRPRRGGLPEPGARVLELRLLVLVAGQRDAVAPPLLIPLGRDEAAHAQPVAD